MTPITKLALSAAVVLAPLASAQDKKPEAGNPVFEGWYADPEGIVFGDQYWIFPTFSAAYEQQTHFDAFSSPDLKKWKKHEKILDTGDIKWAKIAMWAPSIIEKGGKYYFFFAANDIQNNEQEGGIGVAVANKPQGPYKDLIGKPLIDKFHHGAQPIDGFVFKDDDGSHYFIYGGWRHCNIVKLADDFKSLVPLENGETFKEITPKGYVEGPFVFKKNGKYYFMWSEGGWTGPDYKVAYAISDTLFGPHERIGVVLEQDDKIARGAGHHSVMHNKKDDSWYIVYHRRPINVTARDHRETCIEKMEFDEKGLIKPVKMTIEGVPASPLK